LPARLRGKAGLVAQALLLEPERVWHVADVTARAGVSVGLAHRVMARLETEGLLEAEGAGPKRVRRVTRPTALLDLWAEEDEVRPTRTFAYRLARSSEELVRELGRDLEQREFEHAFTAAAAASFLAPFVTTVPVVELWVRSAIAPFYLIEAAHAKTGTAGDGHNIVFLQIKDDTPLAFRELGHDPSLSSVPPVWMVNRFRLYSDLRRDPRRGREQAEHLRREVIGF